MLKFLSPLVVFAALALPALQSAGATGSASPALEPVLWTGAVAGVPFQHRDRGGLFDQASPTHFVASAGDGNAFQVEIVRIAGGYLVTISDVDDAASRRMALDADDFRGRTWRFIEDLGDGAERTFPLHAPGGAMVSQITLRKSR
ncbi:hypothetical protein ABIC83_002945 [Roseateles asaccharophilus]|uniref:hypothetical protein n=1 Tax=Roseateles asaccharophilus TaxID=582607 RepID=UPI003837F43B